MVKGSSEEASGGCRGFMLLEMVLTTSPWSPEASSAGGKEKQERKGVSEGPWKHRKTQQRPGKTHRQSKNERVLPLQLMLMRLLRDNQMKITCPAVNPP